ncbi:MAG: serine--tRNA ligase, partial [Candidatus Woesearchaeota archaeon]
PKKPDFELKSHGELLEQWALGDFRRGAKISGAGFQFIKGKIALLDLALQQFAIQKLLKKGYTFVMPPMMMRRKPYEGVVSIADFENVMYKIEGEDLYAIATSEHPLVAQFLDEVLDERELPIRLCGLSACFRKEIGSHGVDTRGLFRVHQFNKVEQVIISKPEESWHLHEEMQRNAEELFESLEIPFRVVNCCTGDLGMVAAKRYDIEAWFPRQGKYAEVTSASNCTDYQAVGLNIRYQHGKEQKRDYVHTLNATAIATGRAIVAILENFQEKDGSVSVPKVLQKFTGFKKIP